VRTSFKCAISFQPEGMPAPDDRTLVDTGAAFEACKPQSVGAYQIKYVVE
jgi:hypothetical protein